MLSCGSRGVSFRELSFRRRERFKTAGIDFVGGGAYALRQLKKGAKGFLWPRRKLKSVRIRGKIARRQRAASIAERTAKRGISARRNAATASHSAGSTAPRLSAGRLWQRQRTRFASCSWKWS